jgi:hypothetical protein
MTIKEIVFVLNVVFILLSYLPYSHPLSSLHNAEHLYCAGIFKQYMGAKNRVGEGLSYRPARLHGLAKLIPRNRFLFLKL